MLNISEIKTTTYFWWVSLSLDCQDVQIWVYLHQIKNNIVMISTSGSFKDQRVHSSEDLLLQETDDKLPDPTEHFAEIQVSTAVFSADDLNNKCIY